MLIGVMAPERDAAAAEAQGVHMSPLWELNRGPEDVNTPPSQPALLLSSFLPYSPVKPEGHHVVTK